MKKPIEIIRDARKDLDGGLRWTKSTIGKLHNSRAARYGAPIYAYLYEDGNIKSMCLIGALARACGFQPTDPYDDLRLLPTFQAIFGCIPSGYDIANRSYSAAIVEFNDAEKTTWEDVEKLLACAMKKALEPLPEE